MSNTRKPRAAARKPPPAQLTFMGAKYKVADKIGIWPQMQLARAAQDGINLGDSRGLAAVYSTLQNVVHEDDWPRFEKDMISKKADDLLGLIGLITQAAQIVAARDGTPAQQQDGSQEPAGTPESNGKTDAAVPGSLRITA